MHATAKRHMNLNKYSMFTKVLWDCCRPNLIGIMLLHLPESELIAGVPVSGFLHVNEDRTWVCVNCWGNKLIFVWKTSWVDQFPPWILLDLVHSPPLQEDLIELLQSYLLFFQTSLFVPRTSRWLTAVSAFFYCYCVSFIFPGFFFWLKPLLQKNIKENLKGSYEKTNILETRTAYFSHFAVWKKEHR